MGRLQSATRAPCSVRVYRRAMPVTENLPGLESFQQWASGNLVDNRTRGIFAEWLVGQALGCIEPGAHRQEWDAIDLRYRGLGIEVKASGRNQGWNPSGQSTPRFGIAPQMHAWHAKTDTWVDYDPPRRTAEVYVFCLHESVPAAIENVANPANWTFWVISTSRLEAELGTQRTVGVSTLDHLTESCGWRQIRSSIKTVVSQVPGERPR